LPPPELPQSPLRPGLARIGRTIVEHLEQGGTPPYQLYVYKPSDEWDVRAELQDLRRWLEAPAQRVSCAAVSLAEVLWEALDERGRLGDLTALELDAGSDPMLLAEAHRAVAEILREPPILAERVARRVDDIGGSNQRVAVFLYRAGALYPAMRTSAVLEDLLDRVRRPVTLLYPGAVEGEFGLRFMGRCEPTYGYRAVIVQRGNR
jgi:hypothetical protein